MPGPGKDGARRRVTDLAAATTAVGSVAAARLRTRVGHGREILVGQADRSLVRRFTKADRVEQRVVGESPSTLTVDQHVIMHDGATGLQPKVDQGFRR